LNLSNLPLILGSSSLHRQKILSSAGFSFTCLHPNFPEESIRHKDPHTLTLSLAKAKNLSIRTQHKIEGLLLTADQVVLYCGKIREKPTTPAEARNFLRSYEHAPAETISALCLWNSTSGKLVLGTNSAKIILRKIPEDLIDEIIEDGTIFSCAGGFAIDHPLMQSSVVKIEGEEDSVIGLPLKLFKSLLAEVA
jgi:septum formation protein